MNEENTYHYFDLIKSEDEVRGKYLVFKRMFDFVFAILLAIPAIPIILIFGILVKIETPGSMFYKQERVGLMGKKIYITKIRSMYDGIEKKSGAMWAQKNDARVTKVGHFIRKTRIDELPQILNVLEGSMSFIGPRPERPVFTEQFVNEVPGFEKRLSIKPGLSGLAQIRGGYEATPGEKLIADVEYINNVSLKMDAMILVQTLRVVVTGDGAR
ncbi:sugar transferase [Weissella paramesenteroides]|uniref:sugar transferase n=1 Tax=Weissella paramesenteroides TaxID=1249 RepID=UPI001040AC0C|nr:sugar transferase [Weissella paramesenteroides]RZQ57484.1 sugar transferase [Weissella paramesenteroides]